MPNKDSNSQFQRILNAVNQGFITMAQALAPAAAPYAFYLLSLWHQQSTEYISKKCGNRIITLAPDSLNVKLRGLENKAVGQPKPILGEQTRSIQVIDNEQFIKQILLQTRDAIEEYGENHEFISHSVNLVSRNKIDQLSPEDLTVKAFNEKASSILGSDIACWLTLLDTIQLFRTQKSTLSEEDRGKYLVAIKELTARQLSSQHPESADLKEKTEALKKINSFKKIIKEELDGFQQVTHKKSKQKSGDKTRQSAQQTNEQKITREIKETINQVIDRKIEAIKINSSEVLKQQEASFSGHNKKNEGLKKKLKSFESVHGKHAEQSLPKDSKSTSEQSSASIAEKSKPELLPVKLQKPANPKEPMAAVYFCDRESNSMNTQRHTQKKENGDNQLINKLVEDLKSHLNLIKNTYDNEKKPDQRKQIREKTSTFSEKIKQLNQGIPEKSYNEILTLANELVKTNYSLKNELEELTVSLVLHASSYPSTDSTSGNSTTSE